MGFEKMVKRARPFLEVLSTREVFYVFSVLACNHVERQVEGF